MNYRLYDPTMRKQAVNLSVNSDLLKQARALKINLSKTLEDHLAELLLNEKRRAWKDDNREAMDAYNRRIAAQGVFSDGVKRF